MNSLDIFACKRIAAMKENAFTSLKNFLNFTVDRDHSNKMQRNKGSHLHLQIFKWTF